MRDVDIRNILHSYLTAKNRHIHDSIIVEELSVKNGLARIDMAVINGIIHGYEIKSEVDTLNRLSNQIEHYNTSLEKISIAISPLHKEKVIERVPEWWGIIEITDGNMIWELRKAKENPNLNITDFLLLLWKDEMFEIIERNNINYKRYLNRRALIEIMVENIKRKKLLFEVRQTLKSRKNWRN